MKPVLIVCEGNENKVTLEKQELKDMINEAYLSGYNDGLRAIPFSDDDLELPHIDYSKIGGSI